LRNNICPKKYLIDKLNELDVPSRKIISALSKEFGEDIILLKMYKIIWVIKFMDKKIHKECKVIFLRANVKI
jgi:hypothetical protein